MTTFPRSLMAAFAVLALAMAGAGVWFYHSQLQSARRNVEANLETIAQLKVDQIVQWRKERVIDATTMTGSPLFSGTVAKWLEAPDPKVTEDLLASFRVFTEHAPYHDVALVDTNGNVRLNLNGPRGPLHEATLQALATALRERRVVISELHTSTNDEQPHLNVVAPLVVSNAGPAELCGAIILECDAKEFLYPLVWSWPVRSDTSETLLVRRDGDEVLFLNPLRYQPDAALKFHLPLTQTNVPAVMAVTGREGIVEGRDYRGVEVVSVARAIPDSSWFMVAKEDAAEAFAAPHFQSLLILALIFGFVAAAAAIIVGLVWWRRGRFYHYTRRLIEASVDPLVAISPKGKITDVNAATEAATGCSRAELIGTDFSDYFTRPEKARAGYQQMFREGSVRNYPLELRHRDGRVTSVLFSASVYRDRKGQVAGVFAVARDITGRLRVETDLRKANRAMRMISLCNQEMVRATSETALLQAVCQIAVEHGGYRMAWVGFAEQDEAKTVHPVVQAGFEEGYLKTTDITWADTESGRGPVGTAIRTGKPGFSRNIPTDPEFNLWRASAIKRGYASVISLPLSVDGHCFGALTMYAVEPDAFDTREIELLAEMANDLAYGIGALRQRAERQRAEKALRESQAFYHSLVEQLPAGVFRKGADGRYVFVSSGFCRLKKMNAADFLGKTPREVAASEAAKRDAMGQAVKFAPEGEDHHRLIMKTGKPIELVEEYATADGRKQFVHAIKIPVFNPDGKIIGTQGILFDVTELKQAELRIADAFNFNQAVLRASPVGIGVFKASGPCVSANETLAQIVGGSREALLQQNFRQLESWKNSGMLAAAEDVLATQTERNLETQIVTTFGRKAWFSCRFAPFQFEGEPHLLLIITDITGRKRAEEALRESEAHHRSLFENMLNGFSYCRMIFEQDQPRDFVYLAVNDAFEKLTGLKDVTGRKVSEVIPGIREADPGLLETYGRVARTGVPERFETYVEALKIWFEIAVYSPRRDYFVAVFDVITERKRTEEALRDSEAQLRVILESTADGILAVDNKWKIIKANQRFAELWRVPQSLIDAGDDHALLKFASEQLSDPAAFSKKVQSLYGTDALDIETLFLKDGQIYERLSFPMLMDGAVTGRVWSFRDVTERRRAEEEMLRTAREWQATFDATKDAIWILDPDSRILRTNKMAESYFQRPCSEMIGKLCCEVVHGTKEPVADCPFVRARKSGHRETMDLQMGERWFEIIVDPIFDADGRFAGAIHIASDITGRRKLEEQFRQAQKMEAVGQLAGGVAHDFNNILAVIQLQASLLQAGEGLSPEQLDFAGEIEKAAERAANLTRQLLLFSRRQTMQPRDLDLNQSIGAMTKMLRRTLGENIQIQFKFALQSLFVHADPGMLDQVLMNLAVNARDAMPKGGQLIVETSAVDFDESVRVQSPLARPGQFVCLSVGDTGSGIPPEILPRIFEPFFTTKGVGKGTGLGLATIFGIVQQHQGWIDVHSEVGRGTTFRIYLPRLAAMTGQPSARAATESPRGGNETVLLVEDELSVRASVRKTLSHLGYRVLEAVNGGEALETWKQHRDEIHLLLVDLVLPGGTTGSELAERLLKEKPKLKVIYTSGYSIEAAGVGVRLEEGANFLTKPFEAHKLAQTVRKNLDG